MNRRTPQILALVLGVLATSSGCVIPTVSLHSFHDVQITLCEADSGKPVTLIPFTVSYDAAAADSPVFYHLELRTPKDVCGQTDQSGQAIARLADYAWNICLYVNDTNRHYFSDFVLTKVLIRNGGKVEQWNQLPPKSWGEGYPKLELQLRPFKRPNKPVQATAAVPFVFEAVGDSLLPSAVVAQSPAAVPDLVR